MNASLSQDGVKLSLKEQLVYFSVFVFSPSSPKSNIVFLRFLPILALIVVSTRASLELKMLQVIGQQLLKTSYFIPNCL